MSRMPKIHVFLGAPPPPLEGEEPEGEPRPWRSLELRWEGGRLTPRMGEGEGGGAAASEELGHMAPTSTDLSTQQSGHEIQISQDKRQDNPTHPEALPSQHVQSDGEEEEDLCSESVKDYLDSCFPAGQADPEPESYPDSGPQSDPIPASVSIETEYLCAWTVSQALVLRGRLGAQAGPSLEEAPPPPPRTTPGRSTNTPSPNIQPGPEEAPPPPPRTTPDLSTTTPSLSIQPGPGSENAPSPSTPPPRQTASSLSTSSPELYSPVGPSPPPAQPASLELFYDPAPSQRLEEGGVILEATPDGVLCSQAELREAGAEPGVSRPADPPPSSPVQTSPTKAPAPKRSRGSPTLPRTGRSPESSVRNTRVARAVPTTLLARCGVRGVCYSVLVAVVLPCHLKEITVRRGAVAGTCVPLASVVVTDQSGVDMTVVMWRKAAFWVLTVYPGDVLLITGLKVNEDRWRGETVLQSTYTSTLLNLGQVTTNRSPPVPQTVNGGTLRSLCSYLHERRPLLVSLPPRVPQNPQALPHARLHTLRPNTLVHALLRVTHTHMITEWRSEAEGTSRAGGTQKAVLTVEQGDGHQGALVIWGAALSWLTRINSNKDAVWEFRVLLVRESVRSGLLELHSTPWGSCEPLPPNDTRAQQFHRPGLARPSTSLEMDLHTLLSQKYTGDVELRVQITSFQFQGSPSQGAQQLLDGDTPLESILETVSGDVTFTGCGRCAVELDTDANGIYCPCYPCLPHTGVRRYYRPAVLTVKEGESQMCVRVPPILLQTILHNAPPDRLTRTVGKNASPGSEVRHAQLVADRIHHLLSLPRRTFVLTVHSHFLCDENSVVTAQDFLLLDLQSP